MNVPEIVQKQMDKFAKLTGRQYHLFDYVGAPDAERIIVIMGSGAEAAEETVEYLIKKGEKVGLLKVRLYRPFSIDHFINALPKTYKNQLQFLTEQKNRAAVGEPFILML